MNVPSIEEREELWLEGGGVRFVYNDDYVEKILAELNKLTIERELLKEWLDDARVTAGIICDQLNIPILIDAPDAISKLIAERDEYAERRCEICGYAEHHREHTGCIRKELDKVKAERDELAMIIALDTGTESAVAAVQAERDAALTALREAKEALLGVLDNQERGAEYWSVSGGVYEAVECNNAIKSINKVLGEE